MADFICSGILLQIDLSKISSSFVYVGYFYKFTFRCRLP